MADHPQDAPRPPRRSGVLPPFLAPRGTTGASAPIQPPGAPRRRTSQLFTPPDVARQSRPITPPWQRTAPAPDEQASERATPSAPAPESTPMMSEEPVVADAAAERSAPPTPERGGGAEEIIEAEAPNAGELTVAVEQHARDAEVVAGGDAGSALVPRDASAERRRVDGVEIEETEWSFGESRRSGPLEVENFHAAQPFATEPADVAGNVAPSAADGTEGEGDGERALSWSDAVADSDWFAPEPEQGAEAGAPRDAVRGAELTAALAWPDAEELADGEDVAPESPDVEALAAVAPDLRASSAPWDEGATPADPDGGSPATAAPASGAAEPGRAEVDPWTSPPESPVVAEPAARIAESLERIARRVRDGEIVLPAESSPSSDESALALALAALLRGAAR